MSISIEQLLADADKILEKRASKKVQEESSDEEITKLAQELTDNEYTLVEKIASAMAISETIKSLDNLEQIDKFEKTARENGYGDEEIDSFLREKGLLPTFKVPGCLY